MTLPDETIVGPAGTAVNGRPSSTGRQPARNLVALVCAASAGVHVALVPEHAAEGPLLAGVAVCYLLSRTTGIPVLVPEPEHLDPLGLLTTAAEVLAAVAACLPLDREEPR